MMKYGHGGDIYSQYEQGKQVLDFSSNVNPLGLPQTVREVLSNSAGLCAVYPDPYCRELVRALELFEKVPRGYILCGNGTADLIFRIAYALRPQRALVLAPTFSEYEQAVIQAGGTVLHCFLDEAGQFMPDERLLEEIERYSPDMVFLCNPNNPTGQVAPRPLMKKAAELCKAKSIPLVVDECFMDFTENGAENSLKEELTEFPDMMILKAFTKFFAMAGLRLGYLLCANPNMLERVFYAGQPWSVSAIAQKCGVAALSDEDYIGRTKPYIGAQREYLLSSLAGFPLQVIPGEANYLLVKSGLTDLDAHLLRENILIRSCSNYHGLDDGYYRLAVRTREQNGQLIHALKRIYNIR